MKKDSKISYDSVLYTAKMWCGNWLYKLGLRLMCEKHDWQDMYNLGEINKGAASKTCKNCGKNVKY